MARELAGMRIAILATDGVERVELEQPRGALYGAGASTDLLSIHPGEIQLASSTSSRPERSRWTGRCPTRQPTSTTHCSCPAAR